jgi:hypothetical protein
MRCGWAKYDFNPFSYKGGSRKCTYNKELCNSGEVCDNCDMSKKNKPTKMVREHKMMMQSTKEIDSPAYTGQLPASTVSTVINYVFSSICVKNQNKKTFLF